MDLAKLALTGLISGLSLAACDNPEPAVEQPAVEQPAAADAEPSADSQYTDVHSCAGLNTCKGLGGCKVSASMLTSLAEKAGVAAADAGEPHACKGLNACKGLGGCGVDEATFAQLKAAVDAAPAEGDVVLVEGDVAPAEGADGEQKEG
jgi:hypothetical protein